jgi:hypothetical protein
MSITAQIVPWSSVVGQIVSLHDETGRAVAQLGIRIHTDAAGDQDIKTCAGHVAQHVVNAFATYAPWNTDVRSAIDHPEDTVLIAVRSIAVPGCMTTLGTLCWEPYEREDGETDDDIDGYFGEHDGQMGMWCWHGDDGYLDKREIAAWMPLPSSFTATDFKKD